MPTLTINTELDNRAFVPNDRLRGKVEWTGLSTPPQSAELRLFHYTSGKGTRDLEIVEVRAFEAPGSGDRRDFEFQLPAGPPSFSGKLVSLLWALELVIDANGDEISERLEIHLSPTGTEIDLYAHAEDNAEKYLGGKKPALQFGNH